MKFGILSDLHNEFALYRDPLPEADVLFLAGDIFVAATLKERRTDKQSFVEKKKAELFFGRIRDAGYKKVIYTAGNHEHYHGTLHESIPIIRDFYYRTFPEDGSDFVFNDKFHEGVFQEENLVVLSATLWTDFYGQDPLAMLAAQSGMNDYRLIDTMVGNKMIPIEPADTVRIHLETVAWLKERIATYTDIGMKIVIATHHAPSTLSTPPAYKGDLLNGAYNSSLEHLMTDNVVAWFHGHTHQSFDYKIGNTRIIANPRGYVMGGSSKCENENFQPGLVIDITV